MRQRTHEELAPGGLLLGLSRSLLHRTADGRTQELAGLSVQGSAGLQAVWMCW